MIPLLLAATLLGASPDAQAGWSQAVDSDVKVFMRAHPGARVKEILAQMEMEVTAREIRDILEDPGYGRSVPHVAEFRVLSRAGPTVVNYTRLALPIIADRDYFMEVHRDSDLAPDGSGRYRASWKPWGPDVPPRQGVVRITTNQGYWEIRPAANSAHAQVTYYLLLDPAGSIPGWFIDIGNRRLLPDVIRGLRDEALRRRHLAPGALVARSEPTSPP